VKICTKLQGKKKHFPHPFAHFGKWQHQIVNSTLPNWQLHLILYIACIVSKLLIKCFFTSCPIPMTYSFFAQTYASKRFYNFHMLFNWKSGWIGFFGGTWVSILMVFLLLKRTLPNYYRLLFNSTLRAIWKIVNSIFLTFSTLVIVCSIVHNLGMWCQNSQVVYLNPKQ
jgi:hypothetical protein